MVIRPAKTFEELLEENLAKEIASPNEVTRKKPDEELSKPKRKFLKRGNW